MAIYFFYGDEDYNIEQAIGELKKTLDKNFLAMNFKTLDNPTFSELVEALRSQAIMFGKQLTVINCKNFLEKTLEDKQIKEIETALENNIENIDIVFSAILDRNENKKFDSRKKLFKLLSKYNAQEFPTFKMNYYGKQDLANWIKKIAKSKNITLSQDVIDTLIDQIGSNLRELNSELDKLKLLAYPEKNITTKMVSEICISNEDFFNFVELIMSQNYDKALIEYKKLLDKKHPLEITGAIQSILRKRILLKINANKSIDEIVSITGMTAKQVTTVLKISKNQTLKNLVNLKKNLTDAEYKIKSGAVTDAESEIQNAFLR